MSAEYVTDAIDFDAAPTCADCGRDLDMQVGLNYMGCRPCNQAAAAAVPDFDAVSAPISGETKAVVEMVGNDWRADEDWKKFEIACRVVAKAWRGQIDPNRVRRFVTNRHGLVIEPRRYSAFWSKAASKGGFLVKDGWTLNDDVKGGNRGKPQRTYRLRT